VFCSSPCVFGAGATASPQRLGPKTQVFFLDVAMASLMGRSFEGFVTSWFFFQVSEKCPKIPDQVQKNEAIPFGTASFCCYSNINDQNSNFNENT
jgi:hypothetical protein